MDTRQLKAIMVITLAFLLNCLPPSLWAQNFPETWRLKSLRSSDYEQRISRALGTVTSSMPFNGQRSTTVLEANPLIYSYVTENAQASPVATQPMSSVKFSALWTYRPNSIGDSVFAIPKSNLMSEFENRGLRRFGCDGQTVPEQPGSPAFGMASCNGFVGEGIRKGPTLGPVYYGLGRVVVLRSCGYLIVEVRMETTTPPSHGETPRPDAIKESGVLASKYAKDIMKLLLDATDPVCIFGPNYPPPTPTPTPVVVRPSPSPSPIGNPRPTPVPGNMRKLMTYYNYQHHDSVTLSSDDAIRGAAAGGYQYTSDSGGYVYSEQVLGTVPLNLYYNSSIGDYFTTATAEGERSAVAAGYRFVRIEGYIFSIYQPLTVPVKLFWSANRSDNLTIATPEGETGALNSGYSFVRVEGHIPKSLPSAPVACGLGVRWDEYEDGWSGSWQRRGNSDIFDSIWIGPAGQKASAVMSIGIVGNQVTVQRTQPNAGTCTYAGTLGVDGLSVTGSYYCSWWPNGGRTQWRASIRCS